ncbi:MAG: MBOAT family protein [Leptolyngbya sp. SIO4C1]|nr:MBOAT family protein [Leptolyngbya sp. SIO4C1]
MTLPSALYGVFLLGTCILYWALPNRRLKLWLLIAASLAFYASLQIQYLPLMLVLVLSNFAIGRAISAPLDWQIPNEAWHFAQQDWNRRRFWLLWLGIGLNVLLLLAFKYVSALAQLVGWAPPDPALAGSPILFNLIMPLGLSFFCFESIAYLADIYRGAPATGSFAEFAAYKLFFPKLISGPITRFQAFASQVKRSTFPPLERWVEGLWLIAAGAVKKLLIADRIGLLVNLSFDNLERAGSGDLWLATFAFGLQLYLDFSGYVDIARGSALLLGITLPQNFDFPYFTSSIADFWRRWHMSLGDWLRNYLYFPLGGSRRGLVRTCLNLLIVMLIAGIWHGDRWGFVVWGGLHGLALVVHRLNRSLADRWQPLQRLWASVPGLVFAWAMTQLMVFSSWLFFRLPNLQDSGWVLTHLWGHSADVQFAQKVYVDTLGLARGEIALLLSLIMALMGLFYSFHRGLKLQLSWPVKLLLIPVCLYVAWLLAPTETAPYIYFEF